MLFRQAVRKKHLSQNQLTRSQQHSEVFQAPGAVAGVGRTLHCGRSRTGHPVGALGLGLRAFGRHEGTTVPSGRHGLETDRKKRDLGGGGVMRLALGVVSVRPNSNTRWT